MSAQPVPGSVLSADGTRIGFLRLVRADLEIQFAGQTAQYRQVPFQLEKQGRKIRITGSIPGTLSDFKIDPPSVLAIPVKNEPPVRVDMTWQPQ